MGDCQPTARIHVAEETAEDRQAAGCGLLAHLSAPLLADEQASVGEHHLEVSLMSLRLVGCKHDEGADTAPEAAIPRHELAEARYSDPAVFVERGGDGYRSRT